MGFSPSSLMLTPPQGAKPCPGPFNQMLEVVLPEGLWQPLHMGQAQSWRTSEPAPCLHHIITTQGDTKAAQPRSARGSEPLRMGPPRLEKVDPGHEQPSGRYPHRPLSGD